MIVSALSCINDIFNLTFRVIEQIAPKNLTLYQSLSKSLSKKTLSKIPTKIPFYQNLLIGLQGLPTRSPESLYREIPRRQNKTVSLCCSHTLNMYCATSGFVFPIRTEVA